MDSGSSHSTSNCHWDVLGRNGLCESRVGVYLHTLSIQEPINVIIALYESSSHSRLEFAASPPPQL